jgi:hypothetical protein
MKPRPGSAYHGPIVVLTLVEAERAVVGLHASGSYDDPIAASILRKVAAAVSSDPAFRQPSP